jgi:hypothetical protein
MKKKGHRSNGPDLIRGPFVTETAKAWVAV